MNCVSTVGYVLFFDTDKIYLNNFMEIYTMHMRGFVSDANSTHAISKVRMG